MDNNHLDFGVDLLPATTETYNLGKDNQQWNDIYAYQMHSLKYKINEQVTLQWNSTDQSLDFVFT